MAKSVKFTIRVDLENKKILEELSYRLGLSQASIFRKGISEYLSHYKDNKEVSSELKELADRICDNMDLKLMMCIKSKATWRLYWKKNALRTIVDLARVDLITSGDIDMKKIHKVIDINLELFELFPEKDKELLQDDKAELQKYRNLKHLRRLIERTEDIRLIDDGR